jgi:hypothetical protein
VVQREAKSRVARRKRPRIVGSRKKPLAPIQSSINGSGEVVIYEAPDGQVSLDVRLEQDTVWLNQAQMADLFGKNVRTISEHIRNVFKEKELDDSSVIRNFRITARDGKGCQINQEQRLPWWK